MYNPRPFARHLLVPIWTMPPDFNKQYLRAPRHRILPPTFITSFCIHRFYPLDPIITHFSIPPWLGPVRIPVDLRIPQHLNLTQRKNHQQCLHILLISKYHLANLVSRKRNPKLRMSRAKSRDFKIIMVPPVLSQYLFPSILGKSVNMIPITPLHSPHHYSLL